MGEVKAWGGQPRKTYYLPDGRIEKAIPAWREWERKNPDGTRETGTRDANYDRGWLDAPPAEPKLTCKWCGQWHDTEEEIAECERKQQKLINYGMKVVRKEFPEEAKRAKENTELVATVKKQGEQIERLIALLEAKNGQKVQ